MSQPVFIVDAFADQPFEGNPAAVVPFWDLEPDAPWPDDGLLQAMAAEHNVSETAFIRPATTPGRWALRWFTPAIEVPLCGHAALASGAVLLGEYDLPGAREVVFETQSGPLRVGIDNEDVYTLDLPVRPRAPWPEAKHAAAIINADVVDAFIGEYAVLVIDGEDGVRDLPTGAGVAAAEIVAGDRPACLSITAKADGGVDFVSRFFAPGVGIPEDPVTGSSFCDLGPYWSEKLGATEVVGYQASARGGRVTCRYHGADRITLAGGACTYLRGEIVI